MHDAGWKLEHGAKSDALAYKNVPMLDEGPPLCRQQYSFHTKKIVAGTRTTEYHVLLILYYTEVDFFHIQTSIRDQNSIASNFLAHL